MSFGVTHRREQHPVGQGLFHSASLHGPGSRPLFRYVYDCGSTSTAPQRTREIDTYITRLRSTGENVDAVFISHFHEDHTNGLKRLLDPTTGVRADRLFIPHLDVLDRVMTLELDDPSALHLAFIEDGPDGIARILAAPRSSIVVVQSVQDDDLGTEDVTGDDPDRDGDDAHGPEINVATVPELGASSTGLPRGQILDTTSVQLSDGAEQFWEFRFYVDPVSTAKRKAFFDYLDLHLGLLIPVRTWLRSRSNRTQLATTRTMRKAVRDALAHAGLNANATSLCVYSGPTTGHYLDPAMKIAWLGTGDTDLTTVRATTFLDHFGLGRLRRVQSFTVPHHGSDLNFSAVAAALFSRATAVISYGTRNRYKHPGATTLGSLATAGHRQRHVTEDPATRFVQSFTLRV